MHRVSEGQGADRETSRQEFLVSLFACLLVFTFIVTCYLSVRGLSLTADEAKHYRYGGNILAGDSNRFDDSKMPVSALNALPAWLVDYLPESTLKIWLHKFIVARMITVLFSVIVAFVIFAWARSCTGKLLDWLHLRCMFLTRTLSPIRN
jgi:hypothetical protein